MSVKSSVSVKSSMSVSSPPWWFVKNTMLWLAPLAALLLGVTLSHFGWSFAASVVGGSTVLCALWWIFEPIPIPATSLIPLAVFPLVGAISGEDVALSYGNEIILLLVGGAMMSKAMEKSGAHRRIALMMVHAFGGTSHRRLVMGFLTASAFLSMWISNTATAVMLLPVVLAVIESAERQGDSHKLAVALLLSIAYGSSIGGIATPIGTPTNLVFLSVYKDVTGQEKDFLQWMALAMPVVLVMLPLTGLWLTRSLHSTSAVTIPRSGPVQTAEWRVLIIFSTAILAWMTLNTPFGGWSSWFTMPEANYASVALLAVVLLCLCPDGKGSRLLDWQAAGSINWGVMLLFAGGLTLAKAFMAVGLSQALGNQLGALAGLPVFILVVVICLLVTFLTEVTSNTAIATLLMPIMAAAALGANIDPLLLMIPVTLSASCAFMLPVATPPNALVMASGHVTVAHMAREGLVLNLLGVLVISVVVYWLVA